MAHTTKDNEATVTSRATELKQAIESAKTAAQTAQGQLEYIQRSCRHVWGLTEYTPHVIPGYRFEGDAPGTMGIDRRGPMWIPEQVTRIWSRTCKICLKRETTTSAKMQPTCGPTPGTKATQEVPVFSQ